MQSALAQFAAFPWEACGWVAASFAVSSGSLVMFTFAAQWCPASLSATVDTATRMSTGYLAQVLLFAASVSGFTIGGAALMFVSVVTMTLVQTSSSDAETSYPTDVSVATLESSTSGETKHSEDNDDEETESLASFVAAEFAAADPHPTPLRLRRLAAKSADLPARTIGALAAVTIPTMAA